MSDRPLHEYIDLEAYGVVTQEVHDALKARVAELEAALRHVPQCGNCMSGRFGQCETYTTALAGDGGGADEKRDPGRSRSW